MGFISRFIIRVEESHIQEKLLKSVKFQIAMDHLLRDVSETKRRVEILNMALQLTKNVDEAMKVQLETGNGFMPYNLSPPHDDILYCRRSKTFKIDKSTSC